MCVLQVLETGGTGTLTGGTPVAGGGSPLGPGTPKGTVKLLLCMLSWICNFSSFQFDLS